MTCQRCGEPMTNLFVIDGPEQEGLDARTAAFCAGLVERGDTRRWSVYECRSCGCGCRAYVPVKEQRP